MDKKVRCKFVVESVHKTITGKNVAMRVINGTDGENEAFTKLTPNGNISVYIDKDAPAHDQFEPGDEYYVDFTKAEKQD